jgi:murein DD-endopeptidase MepM/ murein hydrolase activator NlpD
MQPYRYPLPAPAPLLLGYGWRVNPQSQGVEFHGGVDLQAPTGTPVRAAAAGTVAFAGSQGDYGNLVVVNHSGGYQTRYAQLQTIAVRKGQRVQPEAELGTVGATGKAQTPHLHFEIRLNSLIGWVAQDPARYISNIRF